MLQWLKGLFQQPQPAGPPQTLKRFNGDEPTITKEMIVPAEGGWHIQTQDTQTIRLFEVADPGVEQCFLSYRASMKSANVKSRVYLEMWCRLPGRGEFFSKGFHNALTGTNDWAAYEIPFYLRQNQKPDLIKLNVTIEGEGSVWLKDIELIYTPLA